MLRHDVICSSVLLKNGPTFMVVILGTISHINSPKLLCTKYCAVGAELVKKHVHPLWSCTGEEQTSCLKCFIYLTPKAALLWRPIHSDLNHSSIEHVPTCYLKLCKGWLHKSQVKLHLPLRCEKISLKTKQRGEKSGVQHLILGLTHICVLQGTNTLELGTYSTQLYSLLNDKDNFRN